MVTTRPFLVVPKDNVPYRKGSYFTCNDNKTVTVTPNILGTFVTSTPNFILLNVTYTPNFNWVLIAH